MIYTFRLGARNPRKLNAIVGRIELKTLLGWGLIGNLLYRLIWPGTFYEKQAECLKKDHFFYLIGQLAS